MTSFSLSRLLLVGHGKMGSALLKQWQKNSLFQSVQIIDPSEPGAYVSVQNLPSNFIPDIITFAVKPQILSSILPHYVAFTQKGVIILSIAAGKTVEFFEKHLGSSTKIIRTMPNTPAAIGNGMTAAYANNHVTQEEKAAVHRLLQTTGEVLWIEKESMMDLVTALSGSGPAYVFLLIEMLQKAGENIGLPKEMAALLARQTVIGSAALARAEPFVSPQTLRENVTSPQGTTAAALELLLQPSLQNIYNQALSAAANRAKELSE